MLITNDHDGPRVVPGRYPGAPIRLHDGPTPQSVGYQEQRAQYVVLELLGESTPLGPGSSRWRIGCPGRVR
jgi:hypothetical protein